MRELEVLILDEADKYNVIIYSIGVSLSLFD